MTTESKLFEARLSEVFAEALEKQSGEERRRYLDGACGGDTQLRSRVESLLRSYERAGEFLEHNVHGEDINLASDASGTAIGPYRLIQKLGEGGFGVVYRAEQTQPIHRAVALKIIKLGMDTREVIARFEAERQALALMHHPNIAQIFDAGATETGRPYFVMELVAGQPITDYCDAHQLATAERLQLFLQVCDAVQHAHKRGIVHRDLKPSNVVVTLQDEKPVPKIIDFGIAKMLQSRETGRTSLTRRELLLGTPAYMSPEQVAMSGDDIDERSDIYSLGALLYEMLTGTPPFETESLRRRALDEIRQVIREEDPPKPSTRLQTLGAKATAIAKHRHAEPFNLRRQLKGDLDWVVMKTLEKERSRRYDSARGLADDLLRHLHHEPVLAGPPGVVYRLGKFARRRRGALLAAGSVAAVLCAAGILSYWQIVKTRNAEQRAASRETQLQSALGASGNLSSDSRALRLVTGVANVQPEASLSPNESMLAYVDWDGPDGDLMIRDLKTGQIHNLTQSEKHLPGKYELCPDVHVWAPDSRTIAYLWSSAPSGLVPELRLVSVTNGEIKTLIPLDRALNFRPEDWSADGRYLLCEKTDKTQKTSSLVLVEIATGQVQELGVPSGDHPRLSPEGRYLALARRSSEGESDPKRTHSEVYLLEIGSTNLQRLTFEGQATTPIWAPKDAAVLFSGDHLGNWDLWGVRVEKGRPASEAFPVRYGVGSFDKRLTQSGKLLVQRKVSPGDGYTIAEGAPATDASVLEPFPGRIYLAIGNRLHTLASEAGEAVVRPVGTRGQPSKELHGGGRWYLQLREVPGTNTLSGRPRRELFAVVLNGADERAVRLTDNPRLQPAGDAHWAVDNQRRLADGKISWVARDSSPGRDVAPQAIYSASVAFDSAGVITGLLQPAGEPLVPAAESHDWSPDGTRIVYAAKQEADSELYILDLRTDQSRKLTDGCAPVWSPDGSRIAFRRDYNAILTIQPDGSGLQTVAHREERPGVKETVPHSGYYELVWSPDSSALLYGFCELGGDAEEVFRVASGGGQPRVLTRSVLDSAVPIAWLLQGDGPEEGARR
jgi:serine/threonine protein kinase/Tol biopolymer transport system component